MQLRNLKALFSEEDAVSPVIGVVLMVAITVILAAVVGTFVLGLGSGTDVTPQASFDFDYDSSTTSVAITHQGGDTLKTADLVVRSSDSSTGFVSQTSNTKISAGDELATADYSSGEEFRVVYEDPNNDKTAVLASSTAP